MPTYDYECNGCGHAFERFQEMSARKLRTCPECGKRRLIRLVGAGAGVIFRGSGFYETDYKRKESRPSSASHASSSSSSSESSSSSSSESTAGAGKQSGAGSESKGSKGSKSGPKNGSTKAS